MAFAQRKNMKKSEIKFVVELDQQNVPEKIFWDATDRDEDEISETKAISLSVWDFLQKNTLRIDLWTKDMPVDEMKQFCIDTIGGLAQTVLSATGDNYMSNEMNTLCEKLVKHLEEESKQKGAS